MMRAMGRPRKDGNKDLPPGLNKDRDGYFYIVRTVHLPNGDTDRRSAYLGTKNREQAVEIYWQKQAKIDEENLKAQAKVIAERLKAIDLPSGETTFAKYCEYYRTDKLPKAITRAGKPLADHTREDYRRFLENQIEPAKQFDVALTKVDDVVLRQFLSRWLDNPAHYNYLMSILSRVLKCAIDEGKLRTNPLTVIERRIVPKRKVYVPDSDFVQISKHMQEWHVRACELIYFASHRPGDVLALAERNIAVEVVPFEHPDGTVTNERCNVVRFTAAKNEQPMEIVDRLDGPLSKTIDWFRKFREEQNLYSNERTSFVIYPRTAPRRLIGKPVPVEYVSKKFAAAVVKAQFTKGKYKLKDLRKKGLTDEAHIAGKPTDKGGHKTEAMKRLYVVGELPMRVQNNLREIRR